MAEPKWSMRGGSSRIFSLLRKKGDTSERLAEEALQILTQRGKIHHYYRGRWRGELDRQGIDFLVYPEADWAIPLQIKSSFYGRRKHYVIYGDRIPCVVVGLYAQPLELSEVIFRELGLSVKFLKPILERHAFERYTRESEFNPVIAAGSL